MGEMQEIREISMSDLHDTVSKLVEKEYRLVQISCTKLNDIFEINYSFDKAYHLLNLRFTVSTDNEGVPSVSSILPAAVIYENEIHDLYGIKVKGMTIDYNGTLYKMTMKMPFSQI